MARPAKANTNDVLKAARRKLIPSEHVEQAWLFQQLALMEGRYPEVALAFAVPNGAFKSKASAGKFKAEGLKPGVPDIVFPVPRWPFHGLYIEMKKEGEYADPLQRQWQGALIHAGYAAFTCQGKDAAIAVLTRYLQRGRTLTISHHVWHVADETRAKILADLALDDAYVYIYKRAD